MGDMKRIAANIPPNRRGFDFGYWYAFDFDNHHCTVLSYINTGSGGYTNTSNNLNCTPVIQRDILAVACLACMDGLGIARFVIAVGSGVIGGNCESSRMGNFQAVATISIDDNFPGGVGPHLCGGDSAALCRVGGAARSNDCTAYRCGVGWGYTFWRVARNQGRAQKQPERNDSETREKLGNFALKTCAKVAGSCFARPLRGVRPAVLTALAANTWPARFTNAAPARVGVGTKRTLPVWCRV